MRAGTREPSWEWKSEKKAAASAKVSWSHLAHGLALPGDVGQFRAVAQAAAIVAGQVGVRHEGHFQADAAGAVAGGAAAAGGR